MKKILFLLLICLAAIACHGQDGKSELIVPWPNEYNWKIYDTKTSQELPHVDLWETAYNISLVPGNETINDWTIIGRLVKYPVNDVKNGMSVVLKVEDGKLVDNLASIADTIFNLEKKKFSQIKFTLSEKYERGILFKIEPDSSVNAGDKPSTFYYLTRGGYGYLYLASVTIHEPKLSNEFVAKWSNIFKHSQHEVD